MSIVKKSLIETLKEAIEVSKEYSEKVKTAKTKPKADLYYKKLVKNNKLVANMLIALDKVNNKDYNNQNKN